MENAQPRAFDVHRSSRCTGSRLRPGIGGNARKNGARAISPPRDREASIPLPQRGPIVIPRRSPSALRGDSQKVRPGDRIHRFHPGPLSESTAAETGRTRLSLIDGLDRHPGAIDDAAPRRPGRDLPRSCRSAPGMSRRQWPHLEGSRRATSLIPRFHLAFLPAPTTDKRTVPRAVCGPVQWLWRFAERNVGVFSRTGA
jgi:hypothetical protein